MTNHPLPTKTHALVIHDYQLGLDHVRVEERPLRPPGPGEVLVRIAAAPINPSDLAFIQGLYGVRKPLPVVPGFEASGTIVAVGTGVSPERVGQRVACFAGDGDGTWAGFLTTHAGTCLPVEPSIDDAQAAMLLVNPLTAWALVDRARAAGAPAAVQTAAASALGRMIIRLAARHHLPVINIVRRAQQVADLQALGANYILDSSEPTFERHLRDACRSLDARLAFDAVGGALAGQVLRALPNGGTLIVYGGLAGEPCQIGVDQLIFRAKHVEGFWLSFWLRDHGAALPAAWADVQAGAGDIFASPVRARFPLSAGAAALYDYAAQMSGGKILFVPAMEGEQP
jgi:NADPH2:quinone reductase